MKISNDTIEVLKNFAGINTNILVREGNTLSTISTGKNIFAKAELNIPMKIKVYNKAFQKSLSLFIIFRA